jgi:hypothetical protein
MRIIKGADYPGPRIDACLRRAIFAALPKPRLKSFYETTCLPKLDGKFIDAVLSKKQRFLPFSAPNIDTACDVVVMPHHVGSIFFHRLPPHGMPKRHGKN